MKNLTINIYPISCDGESVTEVLQWYMDETNKAIFEDSLVKENILDMLHQMKSQAVQRYTE